MNKSQRWFCPSEPKTFRRQLKFVNCKFLWSDQIPHITSNGFLQSWRYDSTIKSEMDSDNTSLDFFNIMNGFFEVNNVHETISLDFLTRP